LEHEEKLNHASIPVAPHSRGAAGAVRGVTGGFPHFEVGSW
jgi:hypothetical protein